MGCEARILGLKGSIEQVGSCYLDIGGRVSQSLSIRALSMSRNMTERATVREEVGRPHGEQPEKLL